MRTLTLNEKTSTGAPIKLDISLAFFTLCIRFPMVLLLWERNLLNEMHIAIATFISVSDALLHCLFRYEVDGWIKKGNKVIRTFFIFWYGMSLNKSLTYLEVPMLENLLSDQIQILSILVTFGTMRMIHAYFRIQWLSAQELQKYNSSLQFIFVQVIIVLNSFNVIEKDFQLLGIPGDWLIFFWFLINMIGLISVRLWRNKYVTH